MRYLAFRSITGGTITTCHDVADGGVLVALAEMALAGGIGAAIEMPETELPAHCWLFSEDQGRYIVTVADAQSVLEAAKTAGMEAGKATMGK